MIAQTVQLESIAQTMHSQLYRDSVKLVISVQPKLEFQSQLLKLLDNMECVLEESIVLQVVPRP